MSTDPTTPALPDWQRDRLAQLLDAVGDRPITDSQRRSLTWLAGWEPHVIEDIAELITSARQARP